jgi:hypothetical protein
MALHSGIKNIDTEIDIFDLFESRRLVIGTKNKHEIHKDRQNFCKLDRLKHTDYLSCPQRWHVTCNANPPVCVLVHHLKTRFNIIHTCSPSIKRRYCNNPSYSRGPKKEFRLRGLTSYDISQSFRLSYFTHIWGTSLITHCSQLLCHWTLYNYAAGKLIAYNSSPEINNSRATHKILSLLQKSKVHCLLRRARHCSLPQTKNLA